MNFTEISVCKTFSTMTKQLLNGSDIIPVIQKVRRAGTAVGMAGGVLRDAGFTGRGLDDPLNNRRVGVKGALLAGSPVHPPLAQPVSAEVAARYRGSWGLVKFQRLTRFQRLIQSRRAEHHKLAAPLRSRGPHSPLLRFPVSPAPRFSGSRLAALGSKLPGPGPRRSAPGASKGELLRPPTSSPFTLTLLQRDVTFVEQIVV